MIENVDVPLRGLDEISVRQIGKDHMPRQSEVGAIEFILAGPALSPVAMIR
jgi:hypothetical protein